MDKFKSLKVYITGVPGTGKTYVAKKLKNVLKCSYYEINDIVIENGFYLGYDINRDSLIIDEELLISHLESLIAKQNRICLVGGIIPMDIPFHVVIVLRCNVNVLRQRLAKRNYSKEKIEENVEAEIMNILYYDAMELITAKYIIEVTNDDHSIEETCNQILLKLKQHFSSDSV
jgi:adenylate kinase